MCSVPGTVNTWTFGALSSLAGLAVVAAVGCSSPDAGDTAQGTDDLVAVKKPELLKKLEVLGAVKTIDVLEGTDDEARRAVAELDERTAADGDATRWIDGAGEPATPRVVKLGMEDGQSGVLVTREWKRSSERSSVASAFTLVVPPSGRGAPFVFAERHEVKTGAFSEDSTLYLLEDGAFSKVDHTVLDTSTVDTSTTAAQTFTGLHIETDTSGSSPSWGCSICANGLLAAKLVGVASMYATGTGAATAACALVGIPTAELGGIACHVVVVALSSAAALPLDFEGRAGVCNYVSHELLGAKPICSQTTASTPIDVPPPH